MLIPYDKVLTSSTNLYLTTCIQQTYIAPTLCIILPLIYLNNELPRNGFLILASIAIPTLYGLAITDLHVLASAISFAILFIFVEAGKMAFAKRWFLSKGGSPLEAIFQYLPVSCLLLLAQMKFCDTKYILHFFAMFMDIACYTHCTYPRRSNLSYNRQTRPTSPPLAIILPLSPVHIVPQSGFYAGSNKRLYFARKRSTTYNPERLISHIHKWRNITRTSKSFTFYFCHFLHFYSYFMSFNS